VTEKNLKYFLKDPRDLRHRARGGALLPSGPEALPPLTLAQGWG